MTPAPGMFTVTHNGRAYRLHLDDTGRVRTVHKGRAQRNVVARFEHGSFRVTGNGEFMRAVLTEWADDTELSREGHGGPCPECKRPVGDLRAHVCARLAVA